MNQVTIAPAAHGQGLFAATSFSIGDRIGWMEGFVINDTEHSSEYCVDLIKGYSLEPDGPFRYLNHSCEPNCELFLIEETDEHGPLVIPRISVEATSDLTLGDQLTIDYGWPAENAIRCGCGAEDCRGWVVSEDELHLVSPTESPRNTAI